MQIDLSLGSVLLLVDNQLVNRIFWCTLILSTCYYLLCLLVEKCAQNQNLRTKSRRGGAAGRPYILPHKWRPTTRCIWNIGYYLASTIFLIYYHHHFVRPDVQREEDGRYFPQYENVLFFISSDCSNFKNIFVVSASAHILLISQELREAEYTDAATRFLYTVAIAFFYNLRYEHYFIIFHVIIGLYQALVNCLFLVAMHTSRKNEIVFNVCAGLHFLSWSYIFLTLLPFNYLLPTLYMKPFNLWLNVFCWMWYGSCVWNSPILQVLYHQTFHTLSTDCLGGGNVAQCLLLRETKETRHLKWLHKTVEELKEAQSRSHSISNGEINGAENQSAKALQTLKCVMTLKRKLKRMREAKAAMEKNGDQGAIAGVGATEAGSLPTTATESSQ